MAQRPTIDKLSINRYRLRSIGGYGIAQSQIVCGGNTYITPPADMIRYNCG
jgi:hypothetical protein